MRTSAGTRKRARALQRAVDAAYPGFRLREAAKAAQLATDQAGQIATLEASHATLSERIQGYESLEEELDRTVLQSGAAFARSNDIVELIGLQALLLPTAAPGATSSARPFLVNM